MHHKTLLAVAIAVASSSAFAAPQALPATPATPATRAVPQVDRALRATPAVPAVRAQSATELRTQSRSLDAQVKGKSSVEPRKTSMPAGHVHTNAAAQGSQHGVKGSVGASIGMTADASGNFDFNADGTISQDENVASNRINAAMKQGVAGPRFRQIDTNGDKILSPEEMSYYHASLGKAPISVGLTANSLGQFDFNGDGTITQAEIDASAQVNSAVAAGISSSAFIAIDTNRNGVLSAEELRAYAGSL